MIDSAVPKQKYGVISLLAHELKTPISALKLLTQFHIIRHKRKQETCLGLDELEQFDYELDRLTRLINNLWDLADLESTELKINLRVENLHKLITQVIKQMQFVASEHVLIYKNLEDTNVYADSDKIKEVLINLISNAIKYSQPGSKIKISIKQFNKRVLVAVSDQGSGIKKRDFPHIFKRLYQVDKSKKGLGLGLFVSQKIIFAHKSRIRINSKEGKGSIFSFSLLKA